MEQWGKNLGLSALPRAMLEDRAPPMTMAEAVGLNYEKMLAAKKAWDEPPYEWMTSEQMKEEEEEKMENETSVLIRVKGKCPTCKRDHLFAYDSKEGADVKCACRQHFLGHDFPFVHDKAD